MAKSNVFYSKDQHLNCDTSKIKDFNLKNYSSIVFILKFYQIVVTAV